MLLIITPLAAAALTILYVQLTLGVVKLRKSNKIGFGSGGNEDLQKSIRAQANLTEWAPIGLLLIAILEVNGAPFWVTIVPAIAFVAGRAIHPRGMTSVEPEVLKNRVLGMQLTMYSVMALAALNILWMFYRFFVG